MGSAGELQRCPECWYEGYSYDAVCNIWCCGRCQATETTEEKSRRDARRGAAPAAQDIRTEMSDRAEPVLQASADRGY